MGHQPLIHLLQNYYHALQNKHLWYKTTNEQGYSYLSTYIITTTYQYNQSSTIMYI